MSSLAIRLSVAAGGGGGAGARWTVCSARAGEGGRRVGQFLRGVRTRVRTKSQRRASAEQGEGTDEKCDGAHFDEAVDVHLPEQSGSQARTIVNQPRVTRFERMLNEPHEAAEVGVLEEAREDLGREVRRVVEEQAVAVGRPAQELAILVVVDDMPELRRIREESDGQRRGPP